MVLLMHLIFMVFVIQGRKISSLIEKINKPENFIASPVVSNILILA